MTTTTTTTNQAITNITGTRTGRETVPDELWARLLFGLGQEYGITGELAERVLDQSLAMMDVAGLHQQPVAPSPLVDKGWHTFLLYSHDYEQHCQERYGVFLHHVPFGPDGPPSGAATAERTAQQLRDHGFRVYAKLWGGEADGEACGGCIPSTSCDPDTTTARSGSGWNRPPCGGGGAGGRPCGAGCGDRHE